MRYQREIEALRFLEQLPDLPVPGVVSPAQADLARQFHESDERARQRKQEAKRAKQLERKRRTERRRQRRARRSAR